MGVVLCYNPVSVRYLIIADVHSNLEALQTVLEAAKDHGGFERVWCLGDIVGYGPDPVACLEMVRQFDPVCVCGNHDQAATGKIDVGDFNADAAMANRWTSDMLSDEDKRYLVNLPEKINEDDFMLVHGSPRLPVWEYIAYAFTAADNFEHFSTHYCLVGHTHMPFVFEEDGLIVNEGYMSDGDMLRLGEKRLIINPGSVGQPRDHDPRAAFGIYDSDKGEIYHYRVEYDVKTTQAKMEKAGLPVALINRLKFGV